MVRVRYLILFILSLFLFYSCVQTPEPEYPKRVNYTFNVASVGDTLETNQNTLYVSELKILADKFNMNLADGRALESQADGLIMSYSDNIENDELVIGTQIGYEDMNRFNGLDLFIAPPADNANIRDNDFFGGNNNFSLIIKGHYNERNFTYRSDPVFEKNFEFNIVELSDSEPTLVLRVLLDVNKILVDENGNLIDPGNQENQAVIDSLMQNNLGLEAFSANNPFG